MERITAVICTLAERGLPFRGDNERFGSPNNGNYLGLLELPCFPDDKTGLILIFTPKYGTRAYFRGMYYFDISKNEVTK